MLFGQGRDQEQRADFPRLQRLSRVRSANVAKGDVGAIERIFLLQRIDDAVIDLAADDADRLAAQFCDV